MSQKRFLLLFRTRGEQDSGISLGPMGFPWEWERKSPFNGNGNVNDWLEIRGNGNTTLHAHSHNFGVFGYCPICAVGSHLTMIWWVPLVFSSQWRVPDTVYYDAVMDLSLDIVLYYQKPAWTNRPRRNMSRLKQLVCDLRSPDLVASWSFSDEPDLNIVSRFFYFIWKWWAATKWYLPATKLDAK